MTDAKQKPGPKADRLALEGDWQDRLKDALAKKKPEDEWPDPSRAPKKARKPTQKREGS